MSAHATAQCKTETNLRTRIRTHAHHTVGTRLETLVDECLQLTGSESLLDIGTGIGDFPGRLRSSGHTGRLIGLDISAGMVAKAQAVHHDVEFIRGDARALPFADHSFDVATARHMLYHVPDIKAALCEVCRVLTPSGQFMALTNADGYLREFWDAARRALHGDPAFTALLTEYSQPKYFHDDLARHMRTVFNDLRVSIVDQWLEFTDSIPILEYWDSLREGTGVASADWIRGRDAFQADLETRFKSGPWRIWKGVAFITAS